MVTRSWSSAQAEQALRHLPLPDVHRGRGYARERRISGIEWTSPTCVRGACRGSDGNRYACTVTLVVQGGEVVDVFGSCTCPVRTDCKHCAALILEAVDDARPAPWRALFAEITAQAPADEPAGQIRPVGLSFHTTRSPDGTLDALLRPVVCQPTGDWTPHLPWSVILVGSTAGYDRDGVEALTAIGSALANTPAFAARQRGVPRLPESVALSGAPAAFWKALVSAAHAGLPLFGTGEAHAVEVTETLDVTLRVEALDDGAELSAELTLDGSSTVDDSSLVRGDPAAGAAVLRAGTLHLGQLTRITALETALLTGDRIEVPTTDFAEFSAALPTLTRHRTVALPERGLTPPEISAPFPLLIIDLEAYRSRTQWRAGYLVDGTLRHFDPAMPERRAGFRDVDAEAQMWERARPELELFCSSTRRWQEALTARLHAMQRRVPAVETVSSTLLRFRREQQTMSVARAAAAAPIRELLIPLGLELPETAILCGELIRRITAPGLIQVEVTGEQRDFREAENTELHFGSTGAYEWLDLTVSVHVDDHSVPLPTVIEHLAQGHEWLVLDDGTYFSLRTPELERLRELLDEAQFMGDLDGAEISGAHPNATLWEELLSLGVVDAQLAHWHERITALAHARPPEPVAVPAALDATLRGYQHDGLDWLSFLLDNQIGGILADDMGLGKTVQTLALITRAAAANPAVRFLVVAPTSVIGNWATEARRFAPSLTVATVTATQKRAKSPLAEQIADAHIVVTSYTLLRLDIDAFDAIAWDGAVFDEAQFVKNHNSKTHQAARRLDTPVKLAITGTPMENNVMELWSLVSLVAPGLYGSPKKFREQFAAPIERGEPGRLSTLRRRLKPIMLRRTKEQVAADLPPKQESIVGIQLDPKHRKIYDLFLAREQQKLLGLLENWDENRVQILAALTRMRQLSLHPGLVDDEHESLSSTKIDYLAQHLPQLIDEGHSALVFSSFTGFLKLIADALTGLGISFSYLDGTMSATQRQAEIDRFTAGGDDQTRVFLISLKAGGFGLNLTAADYCFVADPWWNPAAEAQAVDRAHRIGQQRPVTVYRLVSSGTVEEKVVALQDRKRALFDALIDDGEQFSGALTADDVRRLVVDDPDDPDLDDPDPDDPDPDESDGDEADGPEMH
ncbi:MAG: DEAD/DEAH box helicase [Gordonia sp. (in: high G+C Gram-positive bacteria)]|uniref:DEAD/DEAH box helicase n=1 Tax=Gordonia sp. (in: high G+C Gram-positive bacteria) TaxID=84139 RepID=UPI003BB4B649